MLKLGEGQSAEPSQCGSCQHFRHRQTECDTSGICSVRLPPWVRKRGDEPSDVNEVSPRTVQDTDGCVLWNPKIIDGKQAEFVQSRTWKAGTPSR